MACIVPIRARLLGALVVVIGWSGVSVRFAHIRSGALLEASYHQHSQSINQEVDDDRPSKNPITTGGSTSTTTTTPTTRRKTRENRRRRLVIAGTAKNCKKWLDPLRRSIVRMLLETVDTWDLHRLVIYENDSTDGTPDGIREWNCSSIGSRRDCTSTETEHDADDDTDTDTRRLLGGKVELISETWGNKMDGIFKKLRIHPKVLMNKGRTVKLAYARNRLLSRLRSLYEESPFDYVLMLDLDEINVFLGGLDTCFSTATGGDGGGLPEGWGACCANQYDLYYDLWALRTSHEYNRTIVISDNYEEWLRCDVFVNGHCKNAKVGSLYKNPAYRHISARESPISVRSCFGGATVYDFRYLLDDVNDTVWYGGIYPSYYSEKLRGRESVEHILFHDRIYDAHPNFTMYIQPKMINAGPVFDRYRFPRLRRQKREHFLAAAESHSDPSLERYYPDARYFRKTMRGFSGVATKDGVGDVRLHERQVSPNRTYNVGTVPRSALRKKIKDQKRRAKIMKEEAGGQ